MTRQWASFANTAVLRKLVARLPVVVGLCLLVSSAIVSTYAKEGGWPFVHEAMRYPLLVEHFYQEVLNGIVYPRWLPDLEGGYGYPQFVYYQPLFFFLTVPFRALVGDPVTASWCVVVVSMTLGAVGANRLAGGAKSPWVGLLASALYLLSPYLYVNLLIRGDLTELLAMGICPWVFVALLRVVDGRSWFPLAISLAACIVAHPIIGILMGMISALAALGFGAQRTPVLILLRIAAGGLVALMLAAPYWLPLAINRDASQLDAAFAWDPTEHGVSLQQLFFGEWGFGVLGAEDQMPFPMSRLLFALALMGALIGRQRSEIRVFLPLLVLSVFAMTPSARLLWSIPPFSLMQFPWRLLGICIALSLVLLRGYEEAQPLRFRGTVGALALLLVLTLGWRSEQFDIKGTAPGAPAYAQHEHAKAKLEWRRVDDINELLPVWVKGLPRQAHGPGSSFFFPSGQLVDQTTGREYRALVTATKRSQVVLKQFYFPGWEVSVDGERVPEPILLINLQAHGLISIWVEPRADGRPHLVTARYGQPPGAVLGYLAALLALVLMGASWLLGRRRTRQSSDSSPPPWKASDSSPPP